MGENRKINNGNWIGKNKKLNQVRDRYTPEDREERNDALYNWRSYDDDKNE